MNPATQAKDLINDPIYAFLEQGGSWPRAHTLQMTINILLRVGVFFMFGWVVALASLLAAVAVMQIPLMLNVICHIPKLGYKTYAREDDSVNVWWVGLLAMGEGWHNNHHAFPGSAKTGFYRPWEFDFSWIVIVIMEKLRLVSAVNVLPLKESAPRIVVQPVRQLSSPNLVEPIRQIAQPVLASAGYTNTVS
jgi:fatty-acid desaturase